MSLILFYTLNLSTEVQVDFYCGFFFFLIVRVYYTCKSRDIVSSLGFAYILHQLPNTTFELYVPVLSEDYAVRQFPM